MSTPTIAPERWGQDHWTTFAYVAHWCREYGDLGFSVNSPRHRRQMRAGQTLHPFFAHVTGECPPTRLADGEVEGHDDYSCVEDMVAAGLVRWEGTGANPVLFMTDLGLDVAAQLTAHKTRGGTFAGFRWAGRAAA